MTQKRQPNFIYFLLIVGIISLIFYAFSGERSSNEMMSVNELAEEIQAHRVKSLTIDDDQILVRFNDTKNTAKTYIETNATLLEQLSILGVDPSDLTPDKVKNVVCFGSSAIIKSPVPQMREMLQARGIAVSEKEFSCKGSMGPIHMGHPNKKDLDDFRKFILTTIQ